MRISLSVVGLLVLSGCSSAVPVLQFTDVSSRHTYRSVGAPTVLPSGAVNFQDEKTKKMIMLQSWEAEDDSGYPYAVTLNAWTGRYELTRK